MKTEKAYTEILNQLEIIHKENLAIMHMIFITNGVEKSEINKVLDMWNKMYQDERKKYE